MQNDQQVTWNQMCAAARLRLFCTSPKKPPWLWPTWWLWWYIMTTKVSGWWWRCWWCFWPVHRICLWRGWRHLLATCGLQRKSHPEEILKMIEMIISRLSMRSPSWRNCDDEIVFFSNLFWSIFQIVEGDRRWETPWQFYEIKVTWIHS